MIRSNLLEILSAFTQKEFKEFGEYVNSPFFNKNEAVIKLYEYVRGYFPGFEGMNFEKTKVFAEIFHKAEYNDGFMRTVMFNLTQLAEDFIAYQNYKSNNVTEYIHLLKGLNGKNLHKLFRKNLKLALDKLEKKKVHDEVYFYEKFVLEYEKNSNDYKSIRLLNQKDIPESEVLHQTNYLNYYFILQLLKRYRTLINLQSVMSFDFDKPLMEEIINFIEKNPEKFKDIPVILLVYNEIMLFNTGDKNYYRRIKRTVTDMNIMLDRSERYNGLVVISNYCINSYHRGEKEILSEFMEITGFMFDNKIDTMNEGDYMDINYFRTVIVMSLVAKKYEWAGRFVKECKGLLAPDARENAYNFAMARLNFSKKNYEAAFSFMSKVQYDDIYYKFSGKIFQAQLYYVMNMDNELADHLDSFRKFLKNNKMLTALHRRVNENYVKMMTDLLKIKTNTGRITPAQLREKILQCKELTGVSWMLGKLDELEKKK